MKIASSNNNRKFNVIRILTMANQRVVNSTIGRCVFKKLFALLAIVLVSIISFPVPTRADPLGGLALGVGLDKLGNSIKDAVSSAIGGAQILEVQGGGQVSLAIQQAKIAYADDLNLTYDKLSAAEQQAITNIFSNAMVFEDKTYKDIKDVENSAQVSIDALPLSKTFPLISRFLPTYAEQTGAKTISVQVEGNFVDVVKRGFDATLSVNGHQIVNTNKTNLLLVFDIPADVLNHADNSVSANTLTLSIPYVMPGAFGFLNIDWFSKKDAATFLLPLMTLPKTFGTISVTSQVTKPGTVTKPISSPEQQQESVDDDIKCGGEHGDLAVHTWPVDAGWMIIPSSTQAQVTWSQGKQGQDGDWWIQSNCSSVTAICFCVSTEHHGAGTSGKVHFKMVATEQQQTNVTNSRTDVIPIGWGDSKVYKLPDGGAVWTGSYTRFDSKVIQFSGAYSDAFLTVTQTGPVITFRSVP
jgi:hypothetical protein